MRRTSPWLLSIALLPLCCSAIGQDNTCTATVVDLLPSSRGLALAAALFLNASQQAHDVLPNPGAAYTLLVPSDAAFNATSGQRADVANELKQGQLDDEYNSWLLYSLLPVSISAGQLAITSYSTTKLANVLNNTTYNIRFSPPNLLQGTLATVTDGLSDNIKVLSSFPVCESWVHILDSVLWPAHDTNASSIPLVPSSALNTTQLWGPSVTPVSLEANGNSSENGAGQILSVVNGLAGNVSSLPNLVGRLTSAFGISPPQQAPASPPPEPTAAPEAPSPAVAPTPAPLPVSGSAVTASSSVTEGQGSHSSTGAIVGGVVGGLALIAAMLTGLVCARKRRQRRRYTRSVASDEEKQAGPPGLNHGLSGGRHLAISETILPQDSASSVPSTNATAPYLEGNTASVRLAPDQHHRKSWSEIGRDGWQLDSDEVSISTDQSGQDIMLGQGGFGTVYKGELHHSTPIAIKLLKSTGQREKEAFLNEISILKTLHHSNIVQFMGACILRSQIALITEFLPAGDLWHALAADVHHALAFYRRGRSIAMDIARGTIYMHSKKIIHLDLKSANILLTRDGTAKIADVGLAKILTREMTQVSARGSFDWVAPEVLSGQEISNKADCWSLGVVLWELFSGERPYNRYLRPLRVPEECPTEVNAVLCRCRDMDPQARPTAKEVYEVLNASTEAGQPATLQGSMEANSIEPPGSSKASGPLSPDGHIDSTRVFSSHISSRASLEPSNSQHGYGSSWQHPIQAIAAQPQTDGKDRGGARAMEAWARDNAGVQQRTNPAAAKAIEDELPRRPAKKPSPFARAAMMLAPLSARSSSKSGNVKPR